MWGYFNFNVELINDHGPKHCVFSYPLLVQVKELYTVANVSPWTM